MELKALSEGFKDVQAKEGIVTGYLAHFGSEDSESDVIYKGAFERTIAENGPQGKARIKYLLDHDMKKVVGLFTTLKEDTTGLYYEAKVGKHAQGRDYLLMVEEGIIKEHSIGYKAVAPTKRKAGGRDLKEIKLFEGSGLQFWASNENTPIIGIKAMELKSLADRFDLLTNAIRNGSFTDATMLKLDAELKEIHLKLNSLSTLESYNADESEAATSEVSNKGLTWEHIRQLI